MKVLCCLFLICLAYGHGIKMDECQIAKTLFQNGFQRWELPDWTCLVLSESSGDTNVVGPVNSDGSHDYGLFQINDRYWCEQGRPGKDCNIECNALTNDDISDDVQCARKIQGIQGLNAWYGWQKRCKDRALPNVDYCF